MPRFCQGKLPMFDFFKKAATVSSITLVSRVFGVIRDGFIAFIFGAGTVSDAFFIAFRPFDLVRKIMSDGILSISFIPLFSESYARNRTGQAAAMFLNALFWISVIAALLISIGLYFAPVIIQLCVPGYEQNSYSNILASLLFRIMMPYMGIIFFVALSMSALHANGNFHVPAATPILLNLSIITAAWLLADRFSPQVAVLAFGVTIGGIAQLVFQLPSLKRCGLFDFRQFVWSHPGINKAFTALGPSIIGAAAFQINVLTAGLTASTLDAGAVSFLNYAERLVQFPLALIASPVAAVLLPMLAGKYATAGTEKGNESDTVCDFKGGQGERPDIQDPLFDAGLRMVFFLTIPAMAGIMVLNRPIVSLLFQRGAFDAAATEQTGQCLLFMVSGLWAVAGTRLFVSFFYALSMTRLPFIAGLISIGSNIIFSQGLVRAMGVTGLGLAISLAGMTGFAYLVLAGPSGIRMGGLLVCACRAVFMSVIMSLLVRGIWHFFSAGSGMLQAVGLAVSVGIGAGGYFLGAFLTANPEMTMLTALFLKRK